MKEEKILKLLQAKNKNLQLPSGMGFSIEDKTLTITMKEKGMIANMQTDASAFEGWAICLKAWLPEYISEVKIEGERPSVKEKSKEERHYNRFLYRLNKFIEIYHSWASTTDDFNQEIKKIFNVKTDLYINVPRQDASTGATHCEAQLERAFRKKNEGSYCALNHQLPVRIFSNKETKETNAITPGGFIDIWGIKDDCLKIFELKLPVNKEIGIISELMFYVNVMTDVINGKIKIPFSSEDKSYRSFGQLFKFQKNKKCKKIEGVFLADNFHTMIENKKEEVLQIINDGEFVSETSQLSVFFSFDKPNVNDYCPTYLEINKPKKNMTYKECQKRRQLKLLKNADGIFEDAKGCGEFDNNMYPYVLLPKDSEKNLFAGIRCKDYDCTKYFENEHISWWGERKSKPTGHLLSSQIHCLNHLFALRKDDVAIKAIIENATGLKIKKVYQAPIDQEDGFISFEFVCKNKTLLYENHETRGANCTSVDALVYVQTTDEKNLLMPIEWKYTERYEKKNRADDKTVKDRYLGLVDEKSNLKEWSEEFYYNPLYEFARQTLLVEQIIAQKPTCGTTTIKADDYVHLIVRPNENKEIIGDIQQFKNFLKDEGKKRIFEIDPQDLLSPLKGNDDYKELMEYLQTRYWK
ncbi:MAG: hypothetical protein IKO89_03285 [Bacteroidales bacterium]|nr:hypothetical protein [Bacteroidales bacterium]